MRKPRLLVKDGKYHVMSQINRKESELDPDEIKELFVQVIIRAHQKYSFRIESFVIMGNHFHIIIVPLEDESLSAIMQWILGVFAQKYNKLKGFTGHVWRGRFRSILILGRKQYLKAFKYVLYNPIKAKLAATLDSWKYSSYVFLLHNKKSLWDIFGCNQEELNVLKKLHEKII